MAGTHPVSLDHFLLWCFPVLDDFALGKYLASRNRSCCDQRDCIVSHLSRERLAGSIAWTASSWDHRFAGLCSDRTDLVLLARF